MPTWVSCWRNWTPEGAISWGLGASEMSEQGLGDTGLRAQKRYS